MSLGQKILKEWQQFKEDQNKEISEEQKTLQQKVEVVNYVNYITVSHNTHTHTHTHMNVIPQN